MILGHVQCGQGQKALELFLQMQQEGVTKLCYICGSAESMCQCRCN
jgi:pentatricopeptide repeat protein